MRNFKVKMAYNGANYHGFQRQDNALAVQQVVEEALEKMQPYVEVPQDVLEAAAKPLKRMLELAAK